MNVELADERLLVIQDRFSMDHAEGRASTKRIEAFGTLARVTGFLNKPRDDDFELVYRERRLQPFWRLICTGVYDYERMRRYVVKVAPEVRSVRIVDQAPPVANGEFALEGLETCREELRRETFYDGLSKTANPLLEAYLKYDAAAVTPDALKAVSDDGTIVVPPLAKASELVRDSLGGVIAKIEADTVLEEQIRIEAVDLFYRPVYAFRYRWQGKEAVVEFDGLTGEVRTGGATFEQYLGKVLEPSFLLNVGVEAAALFIPGARLAEIVVSKGLSLARS